MDLKILDKIKNELEKLNYTEYSLNVKLKDETNFNISKTTPKDDKTIGFKK